jgi:hypothetical protein
MFMFNSWSPSIEWFPLCRASMQEWNESVYLAIIGRSGENSSTIIDVIGRTEQ